MMCNKIWASHTHAVRQHDSACYYLFKFQYKLKFSPQTKLRCRKKCVQWFNTWNSLFNDRHKLTFRSTQHNLLPNHRKCNPCTRQNEERMSTCIRLALLALDSVCRRNSCLLFVLVREKFCFFAVFARITHCASVPMKRKWTKIRWDFSHQQMLDIFSSTTLNGAFRCVGCEKVGRRWVAIPFSFLQKLLKSEWTMFGFNQPNINLLAKFSIRVQKWLISRA